MDDLINKVANELLLTPDLGVEFIRHSQQAIIAVDSKGIIILANRAAELMFGYHKSSLIGQKIEILLPDSLKSKHEGHRKGFVEKPRNRPMGANLSLKAKHKDGSEFAIDINLIPVPNVDEGMITIAEISRK